jgi:ABC-type multidrug transport system permease subunit
MPIVEEMTRAVLLRALLAPLALLAAVAVPALVAAQGQSYSPEQTGSGALPWVFVAFAVAALIVLFLIVVWLRRRPDRPPLRR